MKNLWLLILLLPLASCSALAGVVAHFTCPVTPQLKRMQVITSDGQAASVCIDVSSGESVDLRCCAGL
jgi:hypothetical protein